MDPIKQATYIMPRQGKNGKVLSGQCREIIYNVFQFFTSEKSVGGPIIPLENVLERVVAASGVNLKSVTTITTRSNSIDINDLQPPSEKKIKLEPKTETTNEDYGEHFLIEPVCIVKEEPTDFKNIDIEETVIKQELPDKESSEETEPQSYLNGKESDNITPEINTVWIKEEIHDEVE